MCPFCVTTTTTSHYYTLFKMFRYFLKLDENDPNQLLLLHSQDAIMILPLIPEMEANSLSSWGHPFMTSRGHPKPVTVVSETIFLEK